MAKANKYVMRWHEIFTEAQQLNELFEKVATWEWSHIDEMNRTAEFEVNGTPYRMDLSSTPQDREIWGAEFVNKSTWITSNNRWGNTGTMGHTAIEVFGTVLAILSTFLKEVQPKALVFAGYVDEGRDHLYSKMLHHQQAMFRSLGYSVNEQHKGSHAEFTLSRDKKADPEDKQDA